MNSKHCVCTSESVSKQDNKSKESIRRVTEARCGFSPALDQLDRGRFQQSVWQQVDLLHGVGQTDGKLLTQEDKRRAFAGVD